MRANCYLTCELLGLALSVVVSISRASFRKKSGESGDRRGELYCMTKR